MSDSLASIQTVKSMHAEDFLVEKISNLPSQYLWTDFFNALFTSFPFAFLPLITAIGFWYSGWIIVGSGLTIAQIVQATYAVAGAGEVASYIISWLPQVTVNQKEALKVVDPLHNDMSI